MSENRADDNVSEPTDATEVTSAEAPVETETTVESPAAEAPAEAESASAESAAEDAEPAADTDAEPAADAEPADADAAADAEPAAAETQAADAEPAADVEAAAAPVETPADVEAAPAPVEAVEPAAADETPAEPAAVEPAAAASEAPVADDAAVEPIAATVAADTVALSADAEPAAAAETVALPAEAPVVFDAATPPAAPLADAATEAHTPELVDAAAAAAAAPTAEWAPKDDKPKRRRRWPWVVVPAAGIAAGLVVASTVLIAPGVSAAGVPIGGLTRDAAANAIAEKLAKTTVSIDGPDGTVSLTSADLGATIDSAALADKAHNDYPLWNITSWGKEKLDGVVKIDDAKAEAAVRSAVPGLFHEPVEATVAFNGTAYAATEAKDGSGIAIDSVRDALQTALGSAQNTKEVSPEPTTLAPKLTTASAKAAADKLNGAVTTTGFYVGDENVVPVDAATASSWIKYTFNDKGEVQITADEAAIAKIVPTLAAKIDRPAVDGTAIVDQEGGVLEEGVVSQQGRKLGDTAQIAAAFAKQLATGNGKFELPVTVTEPKVKSIERHIDVNLSNQTVTTYENGNVVRTLSMSSGKAGTETHTGNFRTNSKIDMMNMGSCDENGNHVEGGAFDYCTADVPNAMFFNGDEGFHGTWWHSNFGTPMSHGCVNLSQADALWLFDWTPIGTEVSVHY